MIGKAVDVASKYITEPEQMEEFKRYTDCTSLTR